MVKTSQEKVLMNRQEKKKNKLRKYFIYTLSSRLQVNILSYHDLFVQLLAISVKPLVNFFYIVLASDWYISTDSPF